MSDTVKKRLYIGGLSNNVTENEISDRFSRFGKVSDLSLKSRQDEEGKCVKVFVHLNIEGNEENLKKCFNTYQNTKWKGSVLKLEYAKESFLSRLEKERRETEENAIKESSPQVKKTPGGEWKAPEFTKLNGPAVPGTPIPGKKDWVVGKYGRVLPILNVKKSYKTKVVKHDPSKFCHAARIFKDENTDITTTTAETCDNLTWEITQPDSAITKKRKGEFSPTSPSKKSKKVINPKDYFKSDSYVSASQGNKRNNMDDFEVVKIGQEKNSVGSDLAPSRFDSDYEDDDMDSGIVKTPIKSLNISRSPPISSQTLKSKMQNSKGKSDFLLSSEVNKLSCDSKKRNSLSKISEKTTENKVVSKPKANTRPEPDDLTNERRKVPEFAGLGMLTDMTFQSKENKADEGNNSTACKKLAQIMQESRSPEKKIESETKPLTKGKKRKIDDSHLSNNKNKSTKEPLSLKSSPIYNGERPAGGESIDQSGKTKLGGNKPTKKLNKKLKIEGKLPNLGKNTSEPDLVMAATKKPVSQEEDGNDSASSADTDEIISQCKIRQKANNSIRQDKLESRNSLLDESMDLSEFSASAPEVTSNSFGTSSRAFSSIASDSYDSDLDSNDFELVAKKLALKAPSSRSSQVISPKEKTVAAETLTLSEVPVETSSPKVKNEVNADLSDSTSKKSACLKKDDLLPSEKNSLQSKLLETANSINKQSGEKKTTEKKAKSDQSSKTKRNKHVADNEKRLQALDEQIKMKEQQKQIVKAALGNVDSVCTKRIVFSSSDEEDAAEGNQQSVTSAKESLISGTKSADDFKKPSSKLTLLDGSSSDESDYEEMFKSKPQFEGKKGEKLMELQKKIGDSRFKLDEKFMDSEDSDEGEEETKAEEQTTLTDEKEMNLQVLEHVVGKSKMDQFNAKLKKKTKHIIDMNAVRFDPTKIKPQNPEPKEKEEETSDAEEEEEEEEMEAKPPSPERPETTQSEKQSKEKEKRKKRAKDQSKSSVTMSSSLIDMLKSQGKEMESKAADDASFSLLQQFDAGDVEMESGDEETAANQAATPLSDLFNPKETKNSMEIDKNGDPDEEDGSQSSEEDSEEEDDVQNSEEDSEEEDDVQNSEEDSEEEDSAQNFEEDSEEEQNEQNLEEDSAEEYNEKNLEEHSNEEDETQTSDEDSSEEEKIQTSGEEDITQTSDEDSDEEDKALSSEEEDNSDEKDKALSSEEEDDSDEEDKALSSDEEDDSDQEDKALGSAEEDNSDSEINVLKEGKSEGISSGKKVANFSNDLEKGTLEEEEDMDEKEELKSITTTFNPLEEKERTLLNAGRTDIRFTKADWLERWDEIRTDLMKLCRKKHKDAGKRKRIMNEKKRKKDILKNVKRKPWLKR